MRLSLQRTSNLPHLRLGLDTETHRRFRTIPNLELRLWSGRHSLKIGMCIPSLHICESFWTYGADCKDTDYYTVLRERMLQYMPNLKTVTNDLPYFIDGSPTPELIQKVYETRTLPLLSTNKTITLTNRVLFESTLFSMNLSYEQSPEARERYPALVHLHAWSEVCRIMQNDDSDNRIVYRVIPNGDAYGLSTFLWSCIDIATDVETTAQRWEDGCQ